MPLSITPGFQYGGRAGASVAALSVAGLVLHLDPTDASSFTLENTNRVLRIEDQVDINDVINATGHSTRPLTNTRTMNGLNTIEYQGTHRMWTEENPSNNTGLFAGAADRWTFHIVFESDLTNTSQVMLAKTTSVGSGSVPFQLFFNSIGDLQIIIRGNTTTIDTVPYVINTKLLISGMWDGTTLRLYKDGAYLMDASIGSASDISDRIRFGGQFATPSFDGLLGEVAIYETAVVDAQVLADAAYLVNRWGV